MLIYIVSRVVPPFSFTATIHTRLSGATRIFLNTTTTTTKNLLFIQCFVHICVYFSGRNSEVQTEHRSKMCSRLTTGWLCAQITFIVLQTSTVHFDARLFIQNLFFFFRLSLMSIELFADVIIDKQLCKHGKNEFIYCVYVINAEGERIVVICFLILLNTLFNL